MADKSVITNIEARVRQLIDDHKRLSDLCAELTAQRDTLRSEKRTLEERVRELDAELARMQLTEGLAGGGRNREKARARVNRLMREVDKCIALLGQPLASLEVQGEALAHFLARGERDTLRLQPLAAPTTQEAE